MLYRRLLVTESLFSREFSEIFVLFLNLKSDYDFFLLTLSWRACKDDKLCLSQGLYEVVSTEFPQSQVPDGLLLFKDTFTDR